MVEFGEIEYMVEIMTLNVLKTEPFFIVNECHMPPLKYGLMENTVFRSICVDVFGVVFCYTSMLCLR